MTRGPLLRILGTNKSRMGSCLLYTSRVGDQDFYACDEEGKEGDDREPVRDADECRMAMRIRIEG